MQEPDEESVEEPTTSEQQAERGATWMVKEWTSIAVVSIFLLVLVAVGLLQLIGIIVATRKSRWPIHRSRLSVLDFEIYELLR